MDLNPNKERKERVRDKKEVAFEKFQSIKESKQINKSDLEEILDICNIIPEIILYYLDFLQKNKDENYISELIYYYTIIPPDACIKHNIKKRKEKERFNEIMNTILTCENIEDIKNFLNQEFQKCPKEVLSFYEAEKKLYNWNDKESKENERRYIRWNNVYNTSINFKDIINEEYFYYNLTNSILNEFIDCKIGLKAKRKGISLFLDLFKALYLEKSKYPDYFEFACLGLLNAEISNEQESKVLKILTCIKDELLNNEEFLDLEGIKKFLINKKVSYSITENKIIINYKTKKIIIDDYQKYNLSEDIMRGLLAFRETNLENTIKFNTYINKDYYFDGILIKTLLNYARSNLSTSSIEKIFNIQKKYYPELFDEVTTDKILKYIYFIPYNNIFDTERTLKTFQKILIDPSKDIFNPKFEILNENLLQDLKIFVNIVKRKYDFEHEQNNLVTILLFYMYINRKRRIIYLPKEIKGNELKEINYEDYKERKTEKNVVKEAGNLFEKFIYGFSEDKKFSLRQLLFIANEDNDRLDYFEYKIKFGGCQNAGLNYMLSNFPKNQPLSQLVEKIKLDLEEEQNLRAKNENIEQIDFETKTIFKEKNINNLLSLEELGNICMNKISCPFNNYVPEKNI